MKKLSLNFRRFSAGFTLVELLVVIAIIGILAAMLMPVLAAAKRHALILQAKTEMQGIVAAINHYDQDYGRFPLNAAEKNAASKYIGGDFTTGYLSNSNPNRTWDLAGSGYNGSGYSYDNNNEVVAILMDVEKYRSGIVSSNNLHALNPKQGKYLDAKPSDYDPNNPPGQNAPGGVDVTGVYRDPWGNPYIISMDTSYDDLCWDMFYRLDKVSGPGQANTNPGLNGLTNPDTTKNDNFLFRGKVMVWSAGPDGKVDPAIPANQGVNKDNILSW